MLPELIAIAREQGNNWLGIGLLPPRTGREDWLVRTLERIPDDIRLHGWALWRYQHLGFTSFDSTHVYREIPKVLHACPWLTPAEALDLLVLKVERMSRQRHTSTQGGLFDE